ncbi:hypothetical protein SDC9_62212 [bioreactor metagenome]|uniref:Uncharacterized protein n=1 Tax=bioreactor metagenome TaxID=1076179 RepID=A0A644XIC6_9ZZZZ
MGVRLECWAGDVKGRRVQENRPHLEERHHGQVEGWHRQGCATIGAPLDPGDLCQVPVRGGAGPDRRLGRHGPWLDRDRGEVGAGGLDDQSRVAPQPAPVWPVPALPRPCGRRPPAESDRAHKTEESVPLLIEAVAAPTR